jgi:hypothetical protein
MSHLWLPISVTETSICVDAVLNPISSLFISDIPQDKHLLVYSNV